MGDKEYVGEGGGQGEGPWGVGVREEVTLNKNEVFPFYELVCVDCYYMILLVLGINTCSLLSKS